MKIKMKFRQIALFCLFFVSTILWAEKPATLRSPDGNLIFSFSLDNSEMKYSVDYKSHPVIIHSSLGIAGWEQGIRLENVTTCSHDSLWHPLYGERSTIYDKYNGMSILLSRQTGHPNTRNVILEVRAYNSGIAFKYVFPEAVKGGFDLSIDRELTDYTLPEGSMAWITNLAQDTYTLAPLKDWKFEVERPLVIQLPQGGYACLAEAEMVDYVRTKFVLNPAKKNTIIGKMYQSVDLTTPFETPWRVVMAADNPCQLLENNDLLLNLNPASAISDMSWIKPGKQIRDVTLSTKGAKECVDFAAKHNLQYVLFDSGWYGTEESSKVDATKVDPSRGIDMPDVVSYAHSKGIGIWLYVGHRTLYNQLDKILPVYEKWGISGIKFGFVHVGSYFWTKWMHDAVKKCAEHHLMCNIHDEYRPTGFSRTYPNLLTQEGILGNEAMPDATHNTVLPFTRFIAGPADYTICYYFKKITAEQKKENPSLRGMLTTSAHQLALSVVYYSPLETMYWYDKPSYSHDEPELEFFDRVPSVWDDTKVLQGEIGKYATVARRSGNDWFVGTITNNDARTLKISLSFLPKGKKFLASVYEDDPNVKTVTHVGIKRMKVTSSSVINAKLLPSGGQAIWLKAL